MNRAALLVLLAAACNAKSSSSPAPPPAPANASATAPAPAPLPERQLITAVTDRWDSTHATLRLWKRVGTQPWQPVGDAWPAVLGRTGSAWGLGQTQVDRPGPQKREGDGKSPAGRFAVRHAYGYATTAPTKLPYQASDKLECIDDPASRHYTQIVNGLYIERDWKSSEVMRRDDELYTWVIDLAHNPAGSPGRGSCIFLHVWGNADSTTSGCTAMEPSRMAALVETLDPRAQPEYVLLPRAEYTALATAWDLPPL